MLSSAKFISTMKYQVENKVSAKKLLMQKIITIFALTLALSIFPQIIQASDRETEKALQMHLEESRQISQISLIL
jgi:hypothetical protein